MSDEPKDIFEKLFGKAPETGYEFTSVEVALTDNSVFKGFNIDWSAKGVGFGGMWFGWGVDKESLKDFPAQQGFHLSSECMSDEFVEALLKEAMPQMVQILLKHRTD